MELMGENNAERSRGVKLTYLSINGQFPIVSYALTSNNDEIRVRK